MTLEDALATVRAAGYVAIKEASYKRAQERQRVAQVVADYERELRAATERWAKDCNYEERRTRERLTFVWGVAMRHGATLEEMAADPITRAPIQH